MLSLGFSSQAGLHRKDARVQTVDACAIWSRFASPRAELVGSPSLARPSLFAGD